DGNARTKIKGASPFGTVKLVGGERNCCRPEIGWPYRELSKGLNGVSVKADTALTANRGEFFDGLDSSSLIVCVHHGNKNGLLAKGGLELLGIHASSSVNRQDSEVEAFMVLEMLES